MAELLGRVREEELKIDFLREKFSFSKLNSFARCPRKAFYRYVMRMKEAPTEPLLWGRATHAGQEYDNLAKIDGQNPTQKQVLEAAVDQYKGGEKDEFVRQHVAHLESFWESGERDKIRPVPGTVESKFQVELAVTPDPDAEPEKSRVLVEGYIDVVSSVLHEYEPEEIPIRPTRRVVDYKTVARKPSQGQVDDSNQLALYMLGSGVIVGQLVNFVKYVKQLPRTFVTAPTILTDRRKELMLTFVSDTINAFRRCVKSGDFPKCAPECHWCGEGCGYYPMCYPVADENLAKFVEVLEVRPAGTLPQDDWRKEQDETGNVSDQRGGDVGVSSEDGTEVGSAAGAGAAEEREAPGDTEVSHPEKEV